MASRKKHCDVGLAASTMMDAHDQLEQQQKIEDYE